jgi:ATP-dependent DNA helicase RecG
MKEIRKANKDFIESMEEQTDIDDELGRDEISDYEETVIDRASINSLDEDLIERYLEEKDANYKVPSDDLWAYLEERNFLVKQDGEYRPTFAGLLLFGKAPGDIFPHSRVTVLGRFGNDRETKDFNGGIIGLPDALNPMFQKYVRHYDTEGGWKRGKKAEFPEKAFREAVINAVAHRDYTIEGMRVIVEISPDEIVVKSPGFPLKPNDFQKIRSFNATPYSRNPRIASVLNTMGYMEERGEGLNDIKDLLEEHGLEEPNFDNDGPYFVVEMKKVSLEKLNTPVIKGLSERQKKMLKLILENGVATSKDFEDKFEVELKTIRRNLNEMVEEGILKPEEKSKPKKYRLEQVWAENQEQLSKLLTDIERT